MEASFWPGVVLLPGAVFLFSFHENKKLLASALCQQVQKNASASKLAAHFSEPAEARQIASWRFRSAAIRILNEQDRPMVFILWGRPAHGTGPVPGSRLLLWREA